MPINITMPALSPTMEEGTLAKWLVKEGDDVSSGDIIAEIETDKATMEVEAVDEGKVGKIVVEEGTEGVKVNAVIAVLLEDGESADDVGDVSGGGDAKTEKSKTEKSKTEKSKGNGSSSSEDSPSDKSADDGPDQKSARKEDAKAAPEKGKSESDDKGGTAPAAPQDAEGRRVFASPLARRIAADKGLDLTAIKGSGPKGRIVKADVENAKPEAQAQKKGDAKPDAKSDAKAPAMASGASADQVKKLYCDRKFEEIKLDGMRKTIASRLTEAKQTIPHFYLRRDIELDALLKFRGDLNKGLEAKGVKISVNDFVIKACALALQDVPDCNAAWAGDRILRFAASDVAVAVAIEGGLMTPVIRDAEAKTMSKISAEMKDLATRAKDRKLQPQEYQGGAFSVSNLGMMGIENFDAVINPPHGAILAVGAGLKKPVVRGNQVGVATVMSVTLSVDHRVIDGALGAELLAAIKGYLEEPMSMLA